MYRKFFEEKSSYTPSSSPTAPREHQSNDWPIVGIGAATGVVRGGVSPPMISDRGHATDVNDRYTSMITRFSLPKFLPSTPKLRFLATLMEVAERNQEGGRRRGLIPLDLLSGCTMGARRRYASIRVRLASPRFCLDP